jgi:sphinganine-1-phosphate aldolase
MSSGINPVKRSHVALSGYISSCQDIVGAAKTIKQAIQNSFPELFILGNPRASVVAFGSRTPSLNILEVGDKMSKKGWHLNALQNPPGLHIACTVSTCCQFATRSDVRLQRLTVSTVDEFIRDLKDAVWDAKGSPAGKGTMVSLYGACSKRVIDLADLGLKPRLLSPFGGRRSLSFSLPSISLPFAKG